MVSHMIIIYNHYNIRSTFEFYDFYTDERVFIAVMREVQSITDWSMLTLFLGIDHGKVKAIRKENRRTYSEVQAYVKAWLNTGDATWAMLAAALRQDLVGKKAVGNAIKAKYRSDRE